jgi:PAS domain S-box-containing protein
LPAGGQSGKFTFVRELSGGPVPNESEEQLRFVVDALPALIAYVDGEGRYVWANESYRRWFGYPPEWVRGLHASEVLGTDAWATLQPFVERALAGEEVTFDHRIIYKNGPPRDVRASYIPRRNVAGHVSGFAVMVNDITEIRAAEAALRHSEDMLEQSQSLAHVGSWEAEVRDDGHIDGVRWSDETYRLLGFEPGTVGVAEPGFLAYLHPDDKQAICTDWIVRIPRGEPFESDFRVVRPDGTVRLLHTWSDFQRDVTGKPFRMRGTCQDITERTRAEQELREADRRKDEFLAMLSHELRNPLAPILNAVEILNHAGVHDHDLTSKYRMIIARQVQHMKRLLDDLLDVSRVSQGKIQLQKQHVELGGLLLQAVEVSRPLIADKRQQLSVELALEMLPLHADPTRVVQVFANLLNNAAKYTDVGGHITLAVGVENGEAVVRVRDDGTGISPDLLPRAFDLFVQETRSLDRSQGGLGIGLTMVRTLVKMHGGTVRAFSDGPGHGSEFVVRLPMAVPAATPVAHEAPISAKIGTGNALRVLVVDDNADAALALQHLLKLLGHNVMLAHDGPGALAVAEQLRPDLVLLDIGLPGMDGYAVAAGLRAAGHEKASLVALTGYAQDEDLRRSSRAGFDRHMVKPVDVGALRRLTAEVAGRAVSSSS